MDVLLAAFTYAPQQRWFDTVSPHGVGTALGFFLGAWLMAKRAEPRGIPRSEVYNAVTWGAIGAILGARGFYVLGHLDSYRSVVDMLKVWEGGLTMFGGFVGGLVLGLGYLWRKKFDIPTAMDAAAPGFVVGILIGRIGDIVIADHLGERTSFFLGYRVPNAPLAPGYGPPYYTPGVVVHHTAVYDFIGALVLFGFLSWLGKRQLRTGALFAAFSIWYGVQRFVIDFTRNRAIIESSYFGLSGSQWAGLGFALFGIYLLIRLRTHVPPVPAAVETPPVAVPADLPPPAWATPSAPVPADPAEATVRPESVPVPPPVEVPPPPVPVEGAPGPSTSDQPVPPPPSTPGWSPATSAPAAEERSAYEPPSPPASEAVSGGASEERPDDDRSDAERSADGEPPAAPPPPPPPPAIS